MNKVKSILLSILNVLKGWFTDRKVVKWLIIFAVRLYCGDCRLQPFLAGTAFAFAA